jgi:RNA polymerase sigma factor (sigma-70 family)
MNILDKIWEKCSQQIFNHAKIYFLTHHVETIIAFYSKKISYIVHRYAKYLPHYVVDSEIDDLQTIAQLEFLETIKVWNPEKNDAIWPIAQQRMVGAMKDHIRYITKSDPSRLYDWMADATHLYKMVQERADFTSQFELGDQLQRAMKVLTERERKIILAHTMSDQTFKSIGERIGLSESHISRLYKHALIKLKKVIH